MEEMNLGTGKIKKLIRKFSVPCVISLLVAALYNIVDQVYIGWSSAGAYGNAATNIVYPFTVFALGLALLVGDGAAANFSIALGRGDKQVANKSIGNGLAILVVLSALLCGAGFLFRRQILGLFGGDPAEIECYQYANAYFGIICAGLPFYMMGQGMNGSIRADGAPGYAMLCTLAGAIANLILDPVFIFALDMGVTGAAIATVLGQILTFALSVLYCFRAKGFRIDRNSILPNLKTCSRIVTVGMASLIVQLSIVIIIAVNNNLLTRYGYETIASTGNPYGAVMPLAVVGIVMKVFGIVVSIVIGISLGGQPILGYNMGAGNIERVKETIRCITGLVLIVGAAAFAVFELMPDFVISLFGNHNTPEYMEYARLCIRIFLSGIILTCFIKSASIILQSMGNSRKSTALALMRDVIIFVPASVTIASIAGNIVTMLWAAPIADAVSACIAFLFVRLEIAGLETKGRR